MALYDIDMVLGCVTKSLAALRKSYKTLKPFVLFEFARLSRSVRKRQDRTGSVGS